MCDVGPPPPPNRDVWTKREKIQDRRDENRWRKEHRDGPNPFF